MLHNIWLALIVTFVLATAWLRLNDAIAHKGWISGSLSRKIIHMGTGPIFVLCWLLFPVSPWSRYLAALIPLAITAQFALVGAGVIKDPAAVQAMSRHGDRREILRGPLYYGIAFVILTILFWDDNLLGIIALMMLCGGDGLADVIGKRFKSRAIPWAKRKTVYGSLSMFLGGWLFSLVVVGIYLLAGKFVGPFWIYLMPISVIALGATFVESLPFEDVDNLTVPLICLLLGWLLLP